jgi:DNA replication protein DnaC
VGVGKTHIAQALGHLAVRQGANVRFAKTSRIVAELAGGHADRTWDKRMRVGVHVNVALARFS